MVGELRLIVRIDLLRVEDRLVLLHDGPELELCVPQLLLGVLALRDVHHESLPDAFTVGSLEERGLVMDPSPPAVGGQEAVLERERHAFDVRPLVVPHHARTIVGMHVIDPEVRGPPPVRHGIAEDRLHLRADVEVFRVAFGRLDVHDRGDVLHKRAIALVRLDRLLVDQPSLEGGSQHGGGGPECGELVAAPISHPDAVVEPDRAPPFASDEHGELRQRDDAVQLERRSFSFREVGDRAQHGLTACEDLRPPAEARLLPRGGPEVDVVHDPRDPGSRPLGDPGRREPPLLVDDVLGDVRPRDAGSPT